MTRPATKRRASRKPKLYPMPPNGSNTVLPDDGICGVKYSEIFQNFPGSGVPTLKTKKIERTLSVAPINNYRIAAVRGFSGNGDEHRNAVSGKESPDFVLSLELVSLWSQSEVSREDLSEMNELRLDETIPEKQGTMSLECQNDKDDKYDHRATAKKSIEKSADLCHDQFNQHVFLQKQRVLKEAIEVSSLLGSDYSEDNMGPEMDQSGQYIDQDHNPAQIFGHEIEIEGDIIFEAIDHMDSKSTPIKNAEVAASSTNKTQVPKGMKLEKVPVDNGNEFPSESFRYQLVPMEHSDEGLHQSNTNSSLKTDNKETPVFTPENLHAISSMEPSSDVISSSRNDSDLCDNENSTETNSQSSMQFDKLSPECYILNNGNRQIKSSTPEVVTSFEDFLKDKFAFFRAMNTQRSKERGKCISKFISMHKM